VKNRFVLGIAIVLSLQVCFQVFNALERADDRYFDMRATTTIAPPTDALPIEIAEIPPKVEQEIAPVPGAAFARAVVRPTADVRPKFVSARREPKAPPLFETVRITYPKRPAVALTATPRRINKIERIERPQRNERSVIARAMMPVVKKPFEFIKFVGSKLR
jgi:hypothetical protein